ncbi:MAG: hypothetical protein AB8B91_06345 [Rubripirellula sp.]
MPAETANRSHLSCKPKSDQKKKMLVVVLLIALLAAILTQPSPEQADDSESVVAVPVALAGESLDGHERATKEHTEWLSQTRLLKRMELDKIISVTLFDEEPKTIRERLVSQVTPSEPIKAIYGSEGNQVALVGETIVSSGHALPDGGTVLSVGNDGVQVAP